MIGVVSAMLREYSARRNFALAVQLSNQASKDFLTGLHNRRALRKRLEYVWRHAIREEQVVSVAMIDVDWFKRYNDHYGHAEGDVVLRRMSRVLQAHTQRPLDIAARYGGEEFTCVWVGNDAAGLHTLLERIQADVHDMYIEHQHSPLGQVSVSVGAVQIEPHRGIDVDATLRRADKLLYTAKRQGRSRVVFAPLEREPLSIMYLGPQPGVPLQLPS
ncbi:GGDEF domain-containing protein [Pusillimonas sp. CC-YST705]|uniref:diguanylate cyclase n=1 Tax=Mesopusillimonas faecipullorum TaxID=2755040 RepID=A0ABS8CBF7_9BURK|nr:GGDEF domain-containing protein [Mesopusillimonas faecipullorum]MCB5363370.1 GGDEF domain-containing protein [Mesopusillimonas faecipullorum]